MPGITQLCTSRAGLCTWQPSSKAQLSQGSQALGSPWLDHSADAHTPPCRRSRTRQCCSRRWPACVRTTSGCRRSHRPPVSSCASSLRSSAGRRRNSEVERPPHTPTWVDGGFCSPLSLSSAPGCRCDQDHPARTHHTPLRHRNSPGL